MAKDYRIRKDIKGDVYVGSHESNQPQRLLLTPSQPSVRRGLEDLGWDKKRIDEEIEKYAVYSPVTLVPDFSVAAMGDMKSSGKKIPKAKEAPKPPEPTPEPEEEEPGPEPQPEPSEAEELPLEDAEDAEVPHPSLIKEMNREELEEEAERFGLLEEIEGTGSNGYRTVKDFKKFLIPWAEEQHD